MQRRGQSNPCGEQRRKKGQHDADSSLPGWRGVECRGREEKREKRRERKEKTEGRSPWKKEKKKFEPVTACHVRRFPLSSSVHKEHAPAPKTTNRPPARSFPPFRALFTHPPLSAPFSPASSPTIVQGLPGCNEILESCRSCSKSESPLLDRPKNALMLHCPPFPSSMELSTLFANQC